MQQYFLDKKLCINQKILLNEDILYHLKKVLRNSNKCFRLVDNNSNIFLAEINGNEAIIIEQLNEDNELKTKTTAIVSLIKQDKFELVLTKLTELGVQKIVPYKAFRSVVKDNRIDNKLIRYKKILKEASEQCHRNKIPEIIEPIGINDINKHLSSLNIIPYEKENSAVKVDFVSDSITFIIGPEGGFDEEEYKKILSYGFKSISLGKRILRSETAAIYISSLIAEANR